MKDPKRPIKETIIITTLYDIEYSKPKHRKRAVEAAGEGVIFQKNDNFTVKQIDQFEVAP